MLIGPRRWIFAFVAVWSGLICAPLQALAGAEGFRFDVYLSGLRIGEVRFVGRTDGGRYEMQGVMGSSGFWGGFINRRYSGAVIGELRGARLRPAVFRGRYEQRRQFAQVDIRYAGGRPKSVVRTPAREPQPHDISLDHARNALDPISATYFLLRDATEKSLCTQNFRIFEGNRLSQIALSRAAVATDDAAADTPVEQVICNGAYTRLGGFTAEQMDERKTFPFQIEYAPTEAGTWRVTNFTMTTYWGTARATRRQ